MRIELLVSRALADYAQQAGYVIEVSDNEASRMIDDGQAVKAPKGAPLTVYSHSVTTPQLEPAVPQKPEPVEEVETEDELSPAERLDQVGIPQKAIGCLLSAGLDSCEAIQSYPDLAEISGIGDALKAKILEAVNADE